MKNTIKRTITAICIVLATIVSTLAPAATANAATSLRINIDNVGVGQKVAVRVAKSGDYDYKKLLYPITDIPQKNYKKEKITFKSSNTKVATVNSKGVVTGKKVGKTTITVNSKYGKKTETIEVEKYYVDHKISLRGKSLDLSKKYTEKQITSLFGKYSRKSGKYYTASSCDTDKSKTKNGYYISYTDDYHEFAMFEFVDNTLANIYTSADSFKSGNTKMGIKTNHVAFQIDTESVFYHTIFDTEGGEGDLQMVWIETKSRVEPYMGGGVDREYKKGKKSPMSYTIPKDVYLMEMDFVNALRAKHADDRELGYLQWSSKAQTACKQHVDNCWKLDEYNHDTSDGQSVDTRIAKLLGVKNRNLQEYENMNGGKRVPFKDVAEYYESFGHRAALLGYAKYFGMYDNGYASAQCMFGQYRVKYNDGVATVTDDFEDPASWVDYESAMGNYTGAN